MKKDAVSRQVCDGASKTQVPRLLGMTAAECRMDALYPSEIIVSGQERYFYAYIVASRSHTLYVGMTGNLPRRVFQHKDKSIEGFSAAYNCNRLVWYERFATPEQAIAREKQIKDWRREKKIALIEEMNPAWADLSEGWYLVDPSKA